MMAGNINNLRSSGADLTRRIREPETIAFGNRDQKAAMAQTVAGARIGQTVNPGTKSVSTYYTNPVNGGSITVKPTAQAGNQGYTYSGNQGGAQSGVKPQSLEEYRMAMLRQREKISALDKQQYNEMLGGADNTRLDTLDALRNRQQEALNELRTGYSRAMGLGKRGETSAAGFRRLQEPLEEQKKESELMDGFRKGLGYTTSTKYTNDMGRVGFSTGNLFHKRGLYE